MSGIDEPAPKCPCDMLVSLEQQAAKIDSVLSTMHAEGRVQFGMHRADSAIMTCVTPNVDNHEHVHVHVHFIDGGDGGLYAAARELKAQIKRDN